jgi:UDP-glucose 4-epimerase
VRGKGEGRVSFYANRRALVIGGFGFLGVNVTERLRQLGARITIVTRSRAAHAGAAADAAAHGSQVLEGDLRDHRAMQAAVAGQDVIFNLAGQSGAVQSMEDPWTDLDVNCRGNLVLLEALRRVNPAAKLIFVSSRLAYGRVGEAPVPEEQLADPLCLHAVHKLAVEQYLKLYGQVYGIAWSAARLTNPYGPGQSPERTAYGIVNRMIHQALAGNPLVVYGDGLQRRDYVYVDDAVTALLCMGESPVSTGRIYNVGSGVGTPFVEMAGTITAIAGRGRVERVPWPLLAEQIETGDFVADISRIGRELGWQPRVGLADGLQRTVQFYRTHAA